MNMRKVTIKVDMDVVRGLRDRMKLMGWSTCETAECAKMVMSDADDAVLDMVKEFMDDFIQADISQGDKKCGC
jgi:hypothetical protein